MANVNNKKSTSTLAIMSFISISSVLLYRIILSNLVTYLVAFGDITWKKDNRNFVILAESVPSKLFVNIIVWTASEDNKAASPACPRPRTGVITASFSPLQRSFWPFPVSLISRPQDGEQLLPFSRSYIKKKTLKKGSI